MKEQKTIIGLEVHVQLDTKTKLFCPCPTTAKEPNSACCPTCLGMPGSKPSLNKKAVEYALKVGLALDCKINKEFYFSRKTYFYPDLAKNFQITQYELPFAENGKLELKNGKKIAIRRIQLEEDPASLVHEQGMHSSNYCLVDYNRSGIPLLEIVTEPDMENAEEARDFLNELLAILEYLNVFEAGKNAMKCDANISIKGNERIEIKNITSFKGVERALEFEIERQKKALSDGKKIERETRGFDEASGKTVFQRKKETEDDYGYIFEPDLPRYCLAEQQIEKAKKELPELHFQKARRFSKNYGIKQEYADVLCSTKSLSELFEETAKKCNPKTAANFMRKELLAVANRRNSSINELNLDPEELAGLFNMFEERKISEKAVKDALIAYANTNQKPLEFIKKQGLLEELSEEIVEKLCDEVLQENPSAAKDYASGNKKALNFLVGTAMRRSKGKANPREIQNKMRQKLEAKK